jgi:hypothetical protein
MKMNLYKQAIALNEQKRKKKKVNPSTVEKKVEQEEEEEEEMDDRFAEMYSNAEFLKGDNIIEEE